KVASVSRARPQAGQMGKPPDDGKPIRRIQSLCAKGDWTFNITGPVPFGAQALIPDRVDGVWSEIRRVGRVFETHRPASGPGIRRVGGVLETHGPASGPGIRRVGRVFETHRPASGPGIRRGGRVFETHRPASGPGGSRRLAPPYHYGSDTLHRIVYQFLE